MKQSDSRENNRQNAKQHDLLFNKSHPDNKVLTTNQGVAINDDNNSLKAGDRGPSLLEDFILREKITHFDHERIPERVVHARGSAAHGFFEVTNPIPQFTKAGFLQRAGQRTPVFTRFSTVQGSRGSTDLARDVRGFAVKFYTDEGIFDLVGNNMPVFFIQDAMKFPDLVHAVKPEPHNEIPQAASAHDTFWDFISLMPESTHMIMWLMSDRAIPRSYRMMEGFGVNTFRFVNADGESFFVKFHWKPKLGTHAVIWDEAQKISGFDPDFHRRDLWEAIDLGNFPEWELGVQVVPEADEHEFGFDLLDPTKIIPEELVPVTVIGRMVLNKNPDNFFAETEQVAFHPGHVVPGIDFTNDPLLQGRLFSYTDTQLTRLGGPNFHEIPINRSISPVSNNQRDGFMRQEINTGRVSYHPNSLGGGCPYQAMIANGGFNSVKERIDAKKIRARSESFSDHFSQARLFYNSQTDIEKRHIAKAFKFELGKCETMEIRVRMLRLIAEVDKQLAETVAAGLGLETPLKPFDITNHGVSPEPISESQVPKDSGVQYEPSDALSMIKNPTVVPTVESRKVAIICAEGVNEAVVTQLKETLLKSDAKGCIVAQRHGAVKSDIGQIPVEFTFLTSSSVLFDAVFIPEAESFGNLAIDPDVHDFLNDAFRHCKIIGAQGNAIDLLSAMPFALKIKDDGGVISDKSSDKAINEFIDAMAQHRHWTREMDLI